MKIMPLSQRFMLKQFLHLTEDEILENEKLWAVEQDPGIITRLLNQPINFGLTPIRHAEEQDPGIITRILNQPIKPFSMTYRGPEIDYLDITRKIALGDYDGN